MRSTKTMKLATVNRARSYQEGTPLFDPKLALAKACTSLHGLIAVEAIVEDDLCLYGKVVGTGYP